MNIPPPTGDLRQWAISVHRTLFGATNVNKRVEQAPLAAAHMKGDERATVDGIILYDPVAGKMKVSIGGVWRSFTLDP